MAGETPTRRGYLGAIASASGVVLAGCSSNGDNSSDDSPTTDDGNDGGSGDEPELIESTSVRNAQRSEKFTASFYQINLVDGHGVDKIRLESDGERVGTASVEDNTAEFKTAEEDLRDPIYHINRGEYETTFLSDGEVINQGTIELEYDIDIVKVEYGGDPDLGHAGGPINIKIRNTGDLPLELGEWAITGENIPNETPISDPESVTYKEDPLDTDGVSTTSTIWSWPNEFPVTVQTVGQVDTPLRADEVPKDVCKGEPKQATVHLLNDPGPHIEINLSLDFSGPVTESFWGQACADVTVSLGGWGFQNQT
jgi:hypothetical protein